LSFLGTLFTPASVYLADIVKLGHNIFLQFFEMWRGHGASRSVHLHLP